MPKAEPKASTPTGDCTGSEGGNSQGLRWQDSDEGWEAAMEAARIRVMCFICKNSSDAVLIRQSRRMICSAVEAYIRGLVRVTKRMHGEQVILRRSFIEKPLAAVEALKRLDPSHTSYALAKTWTELPMVARDALNDACFELRKQPLRAAMAQWPTVPGTFIQLNIAELAELIPLALTIARGYGNRDPIRDDTIITILREYACLRGEWPNAKQSPHFVLSIQDCYRGLLPKYGFAVNSPGTIYRLLKRAKDAAS
jgi:hypothetical protein